MGTALRIISSSLFITLLIIEVCGLYYIYVNGVPNVSVGGSPIIPGNVVRELIFKKYIGVIATFIIFILFNLLALWFMVNHRLFHYVLVAGPGILGYATSLFYLSSSVDIAISCYALLTYSIGLLYTFKGRK